MEKFYIDNLTINLTLDCNMRCEYCYVFSYEIPEQSKKSNIDIEHIYSILSQYCEFNGEKNGQRILDITWHGGEPLTRGLNFFEKLVEIEKKIYEKFHIIIRNRLQTNATLLNRKWAEFFKKYNFSLGVSLDGPEWLHCINRKYINNESSYDDTIRGIKLLQEYKVPFGILCVITDNSCNYYKEIYNFFKSLRVSTVDFIPSYLPAGGKSINVTPYKWGRFLVEIYKCWIKDLSYEIIYLSNIIKKIYDLEYCGTCNECDYLCELSSDCDRNPSITPEGNLYTCECLIGISECYLGNIYKTNLETMYTEREKYSLHKELYKISNVCLACDIYEICKGGCLKHRLTHLNKEGEIQDCFCVAKKMIIKFILKDLFHKDKWG